MKKILLFMTLVNITNLNAMKKITSELAKVKIQKFDKLKRPKSVKQLLLSKYENNNFFNSGNFNNFKNHKFQQFSYTKNHIKNDTQLLLLNRPFGLTQQSDGYFKVDKATLKEAREIFLNKKSEEINRYLERMATDLLKMIEPKEAIKTLETLFTKIEAFDISYNRHQRTKLHDQLTQNTYARNIVLKMIGKSQTLDQIKNAINTFGPDRIILIGIGRSSDSFVVFRNFIDFFNESKKYLIKIGKTSEEIIKIHTKIIRDSKIIEIAEDNMEGAESTVMLSDNVQNNLKIIWNNQKLIDFIRTHTNKNGEFEFQYQND